jgi:hypothetical protein
VPLHRVRLTAAKSSLGRHGKLRLARPRARTQPRPWKTDSASPDPRARTQPRPRKTDSASPDLGLGLGLDPGRRTPPRPTPGLGLSLGLERRSPPRPTQGSDSASTSKNELRLARPQGSDSTSTLEEPPPRPTSGSDPPRHREGHQYPTPSYLRLRGTRPTSHLARPGKQVMMAPRVLHDNGGSQPLTEARRRQQGPDSPDSCTSTRLKHSSDVHDIT